MATWVEILDSPVRAEEILRHLKNPAHGGLSLFLGAVRDRNHGRTVSAVTYECHRKLAEKELRGIIQESLQKWGEEMEIIVLHGTGRMEVGQLSVGVGVSSRHRAEAFEACRYIIEQLKVRVPLWKQEHYTDGDSEWLKGHELCQH